jgi:hypothetical protein
LVSKKRTAKLRPFLNTLDWTLNADF